MFSEFGRTLLFIVFLILLFAGIKMAGKLAAPTVSKFSPALAAALS